MASEAEIEAALTKYIAREIAGLSAFECMKAALEAAERARWQPIETAPKDETDILVWRPDEGDGGFDAHAGVDCWNKGSWWHSRRDQQPTHWQPLPSPPENSK